MFLNVEAFIAMHHLLAKADIMIPAERLNSCLTKANACYIIA